MHYVCAFPLLQDAPVQAAVTELKARKQRVEEVKQKLQEQAAADELEEARLFDDE